MDNPRVLGQEFAGERRFAGTVRPGNDEAARRFGGRAVHFSQWILISFSSGLKSVSAVMSSAFFSRAGGAPKASPRPRPCSFFRRAADSASSLPAGTASSGVVCSNWRAGAEPALPCLRLLGRKLEGV